MDETAEVIVKVVEGQKEMEAAARVRQRVFVEEQGVSPQQEYDEYDAVATHVVAVNAGQAIGTGRFYRLASGQARIGRMAVDLPWRRTGTGSRILRLLEAEAHRQGLEQVVLHAQTYVQAFYAGHGYVPEGSVFMEAGIEHIAMRKELA